MSCIKLYCEDGYSLWNSIQQGMVVHTCNTSPWEPKAGGSQVRLAWRMFQEQKGMPKIAAFLVIFKSVNFYVTVL